jgi:hypothetical protein
MTSNRTKKKKLPGARASGSFLFFNGASAGNRRSRAAAHSRQQVAATECGFSPGGLIAGAD